MTSEEIIPTNVNGVLLINKPQDWTSHDVVNCIRGRLRLKKVGHCGTLDPLATGLLVVVIGKATKKAEFYAGQSKTYKTTMLLGTITDSQDITGTILAENEVQVEKSEVEATINSFVGDIQQVPPMVSAIKIKGTPLYKIARKGKEVHRDPRPITIHSVDISRIEEKEADFTVHCSKGTYIRTLCNDIGEKLKCGACMKTLERTQSGDFQLTPETLTMDQIKEMTLEQVLPYLIPLEEKIEEVQV